MNVHPGFGNQYPVTCIVVQFNSATPFTNHHLETRFLGRLTSWSHFNDIDSWKNLPSYSFNSASNPLYQWILAFLTLRHFPLGDSHLFLPRAPEQLEYPGIHPSEADLAD